MTLQRQITTWIVLLCLLVALLFVFSAILLPFIAGFVLAYFLDPVADWLERLGLPRLGAVFTILGSALLLVIFILLMVLPVLGTQISTFADNLPTYAHNLMAMFNDLAPSWLKSMLSNSESKLPDSAAALVGKAATWAGTLLKSLWTGGMALVNVLSLLVITPIVAFYMLYDWDQMVATVDSWLPRDYVDTIRSLARQMDAAMAGFIRGQGTVCLTLGSFYALALMLVGLNFGLLIGLLAGFLSFIPYVGSLVGGILSIGMALIQFWPDWVSIALVVAIFVVGQFVEGNFLSPKLVGGRIGLHPVWLMFALVAFGYLFGFVGLLLAVPMAAAVGVLARFGLRQYLASKLYTGDSEGDGSAA